MDKFAEFDTLEAKRLRDLLLTIANAPERDEHFLAVKLMCTVALDFYDGVLRLVAGQNGIAAQALVRTLFETIVTTVILAQRPDLLETFRRHGKYTHLRSLHFAKTDINEAAGRKRAALHAQYQAEMAVLHKEFGDNPWHGMRVAESFEAAGFERNLHGRYYRPASAIAHGQPHTIVRVGEDGICTFERTAPGRLNGLFAAYILGSMMVVHLIESLGKVFGFDFSNKLDSCRSGIDVWKARHIEFFEKLTSPKG